MKARTLISIYLKRVMSTVEERKLALTRMKLPQDTMNNAGLFAFGTVNLMCMV